MKAIVILAGIFAVVAVAQAYPSNMLDTFLQALDLPADLEQAPIMEIQEYNEKSYEEVRYYYYNYCSEKDQKFMLLKLIFVTYNINSTRATPWVQVVYNHKALALM